MMNKSIFQLLTALTVALSLCCSVHSVAIRSKPKKSLPKKLPVIVPETDASDYFMPEYRPSSDISSDVLRSLMNNGGVDSAIGGDQMSPDAYAMLPLVAAGDKRSDASEDMFRQLMSKPTYALMPSLISKDTKVRGDALMTALASRSAKSGAGSAGLRPADWLKLLLDCLQQLTETLDDYEEMPKLWKKGR